MGFLPSMLFLLCMFFILKCIFSFLSMYAMPRHFHSTWTTLTRIWSAHLFAILYMLRKLHFMENHFSIALFSMQPLYGQSFSVCLLRMTIYELYSAQLSNECPPRMRYDLWFFNNDALYIFFVGCSRCISCKFKIVHCTMDISSRFWRDRLKIGPIWNFFATEFVEKLCWCK